MSSATKCLLALLVGAVGLPCLGATDLRVCADPNNLPYSNDQEQGFENQLAALIAKDLNMQVSYFWFPQRSAFFRKSLNSGACDVVMGVPAGFDEADTALRQGRIAQYRETGRAHGTWDCKATATIPELLGSLPTAAV